MHMIRNALQCGMLMAILNASATVMAQEKIYGGIGVGPSRTYIPSNALGITGATASELQRSENSTGAKIFAGYRANPNMAVEVGYVDLGKSRATRNMTAPGTGSIGIDSRNTGWFVDLVGMMPTGISDVSVIGKLGGVATETGKQLSTTGAVSLAPGSPSTFQERELNWKFGAGAQYDFSKTMAARGEWERYRRMGKDTGVGESEADLFSLNLLIRFH
jgi:OOP family OmpA-OmpF porin